MNHYKTMSEFTIYDGGLTEKEWRVALDRYLTEGNLLPEQYEGMSPAQQRIIQEIKKSIKRINYVKKSDR